MLPVTHFFFQLTPSLFMIVHPKLFTLYSKLILAVYVGLFLSIYCIYPWTQFTLLLSSSGFSLSGINTIFCRKLRLVGESDMVQQVKLLLGIPVQVVYQNAQDWLTPVLWSSFLLMPLGGSRRWHKDLHCWHTPKGVLSSWLQLAPFQK